METSIRPYGAKLCRHLSSLLRMPDRFNPVGPVLRINHSFPRLECSIESVWCKSIKSFLLRRPIIALLIDVPIEGHRPCGLLSQVQKILILLQVLQGELPFRYVLMYGNDVAWSSLLISEKGENDISPNRSSIFQNEMLLDSQ